MCNEPPGKEAPSEVFFDNNAPQTSGFETVLWKEYEYPCRSFPKVRF